MFLKVFSNRERLNEAFGIIEIRWIKGTGIGKRWRIQQMNREVEEQGWNNEGATNANVEYQNKEEQVEMSKHKNGEWCHYE